MKNKNNVKLNCMYHPICSIILYATKQISLYHTYEIADLSMNDNIHYNEQLKKVRKNISTFPIKLYFR